MRRFSKHWLSDFIIYVILGCSIAGCGVNHNIKQYKKHKAKIIAKGESIPKDTIIVTENDTITETITKNDTVFVTKTITNTVTLEPEIIVKTKWQTRVETKYKYKTVKVENRAMIDSLKQVLKREKQAHKENIKRSKYDYKKNKRNNWWLCLRS